MLRSGSASLSDRYVALTSDNRFEDVYEAGAVLGKGAFSVVRRARHRQSGEHVRWSTVSSVSLSKICTIFPLLCFLVASP